MGPQLCDPSTDSNIFIKNLKLLSYLFSSFVVCIRSPTSHFPYFLLLRYRNQSTSHRFLEISPPHLVPSNQDDVETDQHLPTPRADMAHQSGIVHLPGGAGNSSWLAGELSQFDWTLIDRIIFETDAQFEMDRTTRHYGKFQGLQKAHHLVVLADKEKLDNGSGCWKTLQPQPCARACTMRHI